MPNTKLTKICVSCGAKRDGLCPCGYIELHDAIVGSDQLLDRWVGQILDRNPDATFSCVLLELTPGERARVRASYKRVSPSPMHGWITGA